MTEPTDRQRTSRRFGMDDIPEDWYLVVVKPMPLFPSEEPFYDGQPRLKDGRFTFGKMPNFDLPRVAPEWKVAGYSTNERASNILGEIGGQTLAHPKIPERIHFYKKGVKHAIGTADSLALEKILRLPEMLKEIFRRGDCKPDVVHEDKRQYADKCWHVKATVRLNGGKRGVRLEFVVLHHLGLQRNVLYDVKARKTKKEPAGDSKQRRRAFVRPNS